MKTYILLLLIMIFPASLAAQGKLEGKILDTDGETGLPGASVYWSGTTTGTTTNLAGYFEIRKTRSTNKLVVSFVGYKSDTITIGSDESYREHTLSSGSDAGEVTVIGSAAGNSYQSHGTDPNHQYRKRRVQKSCMLQPLGEF
jgi:outer membrane receptor for ferrienterochelin and colicins